MRLVLDTNVVFSALLWRGKPYQLLDAISQHPDRSLFSSPALLDELADVLARPMATRRLALIGTNANTVLALYRKVVEVVEPTLVPVSYTHLDVYKRQKLRRSFWTNSGRHTSLCCKSRMCNSGRHHLLLHHSSS